MPGSSLSLNAQSTRRMTARLGRQDGTPITLAALDALVLTVYDQPSKVLIRPTQDVLNANGVTVEDTTDDDGNDITLLTWDISIFETELLGATSKENHLAYFEWAYDAEDTIALTNPFQTVAGSAIVTVNQTGHGLSVNDAIMVVNADDVGGLKLTGVHKVTAVNNPNQYTIQHKPRIETITAAASSSATGGGSPTILSRPQTDKYLITLRLQEVDVT